MPFEKLVGTGGSAVSSTSGQLPTSTEIEEVRGIGPAREMYSQSVLCVVCIPDMSTFRPFPSLFVSLCLLARLYTAIHRPPAPTHLHMSQAP